MSLIVDPIVTPDPSSLPAQGGTTRVTFQANTDQGSSLLEADYSLDPGTPYILTGSSHLPSAQVSTAPRDYPKSLTLQHTGSGSVANVRINVAVREVGSGQTFNRSCRVTVEIGERLQAFRETNGLTQQNLADQLGISRSHVSRIELGASHSDNVHRKIEELLKEG